MILGLLSDIHEDQLHLQKALTLLEKKGVSEIACLGDVGGFSAYYYQYGKRRSASRCWEIVQQNCQYILPGNHDLFAVRKISRYMEECGIPSDWYQLALDERKRIAEDRFWLYEPEEEANDLTLDQKNFIRNLPDEIRVETDKISILLTHYVYPDLSGAGTVFLPDSKLNKSHLEYMVKKEAELSFFGHCHPEGFIRIHPEEYQICPYKKLFHLVPGTAIGLPCIADGRNRPGIALFNTTDQSFVSIPLSSKLKRLWQ